MCATPPISKNINGGFDGGPNPHGPPGQRITGRCAVGRTCPERSYGSLRLLTHRTRATRSGGRDAPRIVHGSGAAVVATYEARNGPAKRPTQARAPARQPSGSPAPPPPWARMEAMVTAAVA